jgi:uncharacterized OB-fold protein
MSDNDTAEPAVSGWMRLLDDGRINLLARRCKNCATVLFPPPVRCTACSNDRLHEVPLGPEAVLYSITVDRLGTFLRRPHPVGQVRFTEGPLVQGYVDADVDSLPSVGTAMELVPFQVPDGDQALLTYAFRTKGV